MSISFSFAKTINLLFHARKLISKHWTQDTFARNQQGQHVSVLASDASSWCAYGALLKAGNRDKPVLAAFQALNAVAKEAGFDNLIQLNDYTTREAVLAVYDRAINQLLMQARIHGAHDA